MSHDIFFKVREPTTQVFISIILLFKIFHYFLLDLHSSDILAPGSSNLKY